MLRYTVKLTLNEYFMKYSERKMSQCILPFRQGRMPFFGEAVCFNPIEVAYLHLKGSFIAYITRKVKPLVI